MTRVAFPTFARRRDDDVALRNGFLEMMRLVALISLPALVGLAIVAPQLVPALFGSKWHGAVVLIQILSLLGIAKALGNPFGSLLLAKGRADISFWSTVLQFCFIATGIAIGIQYGVVGAAIGEVIAVVALWVPLLPVFVRVVALPVRRFFTNLARPASLAAGMGLVLIGLSIPIAKVSDEAAQMLVIQIVLGAMIYGGLLVLFERSYLRSLWKLAVHSPAVPTGVELTPIDDR
jgi:O-antigen/teichoic acid export membrane protein